MKTAARAVQDVLADMPDEYHLGLSNEAARRVVLAVLNAIREPDDKLVDTLLYAIDQGASTDDVRDGWHAAIDNLVARLA